METEYDGPPKLMYKGPGREKHQNIVEVFDEILNRLDEIDQILSNIQNSLTNGTHLQ